MSNWTDERVVRSKTSFSHGEINLDQQNKHATLLHTISSQLMQLLRKYKCHRESLTAVLFKAMLHGAIFLATCNAILLLRDVKFPNTSLHYTPLMFSQHIENYSLISLINISQE
jgi:Holliday junction resolvasome RuvABC endonuclease subunit